MKNSKSLTTAISALIVLSGCGEPSGPSASTSTADETAAQQAPDPQQEQAALVKHLHEMQQERIQLFKRSVDENSKAGLEALKGGDLEKAESMLLVALAQVQQYEGQAVREAVILNNLASVYEQKKMYAQSIPLYSRSQKLFIRAYGRKYPAVAMTLASMGRVLGKQARWDEASAVYRTAVQLMEENEKRDKEEYISTLEAYINALRITGQGMRQSQMEEKLREARGKS